LMVTEGAARQESLAANIRNAGRNRTVRESTKRMDIAPYSTGLPPTEAS
jgi:hypothetical protein